MGWTSLRLDGKSSLRQDLSMKCKGLIVAALLLATPLCANAERGFVSNSKDVTFSITSPQDGSLWIATESRGLIRLGATGRTFAYSSATGDFPCDSISALAFDSAGILYMKDSRGDIYSYTTLYGFKLQKEAPADVVFEGVEKGEPVSLPSREPSTPYRNHPTWPYLVVIVLLCVVIVYTRVLAAHKPAKPEKVNNAPQPVPEPKVELKTIEKPEQEKKAEGGRDAGRHRPAVGKARSSARHQRITGG